MLRGESWCSLNTRADGCQSDDFVCEICGSLATCEHDDIEGVEPRWDNTADVETINIASRLSHLPLEVIRSLFDPQQNTLDLTVKTPFEPGQEVYNTYGEGMGWAKQACEWGFIDESIEGDGALGQGLRWELTDVLERDDENYESRKGEWKRQCKQAVDGGEDPQAIEEGASLFSGAGDPKDLLLSEDGQLSYPLFWAIVCAREPKIKDKTVGKTLDALCQSLYSEDTTHESWKSREDSAVLRGIINGVIDLCESRIGRTRHADRSTSELCDMLDSVSLRSDEPSPLTLLLAFPGSIPEPYRPQDLNFGEEGIGGSDFALEGDGKCPGSRHTSFVTVAAVLVRWKYDMFIGYKRDSTLH